MENPPASQPQPKEEPPHCVIPIHRPNWKEYAFFFSCGILVSIPFTLFFGQAYPYFPEFVVIVLLAPFIEELAKVFPLFYRHGETERSLVVLGILIGLGFGISEFVLYVGFLGVDPLARIPGIIFHASSAAITAYGIAKKKPLPYYLTAVGLHMANNFFAVTGYPIISIFGDLVVLITTYYLAWTFYHKASKDKMVV
ncbi:MAG: PrsW family glutamic-type intramembrane protease [Candidatus Bathyarchaeia archaeon]|jgi:RsiW-degrading membrane proteinase PrsW (M82 family)